LEADRQTPLLAVGAASGWYSRPTFSAVALIAVSNGVLIEILVLSRLLYGMARRGWLPAWLGAVNGRTATPIPATAVAGAGVLALATAFDTGFLASATSAITLLVFATVSAGLWRLQRRRKRPSGFSAPRLVPPLAALLCLGLVAAQLVLT
jgi:amino acid transporter